MSADVLDYRKRLERRKAMGDAVVISMRNSCDVEFRRIQAEQRDRQFTTKLASALREIYMVHGDTCIADAIKVNADIEARKILRCQT